MNLPWTEIAASGIPKTSKPAHQPVCIYHENTKTEEAPSSGTSSYSFITVRPTESHKPASNLHFHWSGTAESSSLPIHHSLIRHPFLANLNGMV